MPQVFILSTFFLCCPSNVHPSSLGKIIKTCQYFLAIIQLSSIEIGKRCQKESFNIICAHRGLNKQYCLVIFFPLFAFWPNPFFSKRTWMLPTHNLDPCYAWCGLGVHDKPKPCIGRPKMCVDSTKMHLGTTKHIMDGQKGNPKKQKTTYKTCNNNYEHI